MLVGTTRCACRTRDEGCMDTERPELVGRALALAERSGFEHSCAPAVGRLLAVLAGRVRGGLVGEIGTGCGVGTAWMTGARLFPTHGGDRPGKGAGRPGPLRRGSERTRPGGLLAPVVGPRSLRPAVRRRQQGQGARARGAGGGPQTGRHGVPGRPDARGPLARGVAREGRPRAAVLAARPPSGGGRDLDRPRGGRAIVAVRL